MVHKRRGEDIPDGHGPDETYVFSRVEDRSKLMRLSYLYDKWKPIIMAVILFLLAAGFGFQTPKSAFEEIRKEQKATNDRVQRLEDLAIVLNAMIRLKCVELVDRPRDLQLAGIDCAALTKAATTQRLPNNP
jgi:hypothetical protein